MGPRAAARPVTMDVLLSRTGQASIARSSDVLPVEPPATGVQNIGIPISGTMRSTRRTFRRPGAEVGYPRSGFPNGLFLVASYQSGQQLWGAGCVRVLNFQEPQTAALVRSPGHPKERRSGRQHVNNNEAGVVAAGGGEGLLSWSTPARTGRRQEVINPRESRGVDDVNRSKGRSCWAARERRLLEPPSCGSQTVATPRVALSDICS